MDRDFRPDTHVFFRSTRGIKGEEGDLELYDIE